MSRFDFLGFGYGGGCDKELVANAKKYTPEQIIKIYKSEYSHRAGRTPILSDVKSAWCAFRFGVDNFDYPEGCYTFVDEGARGAFPVYVIRFEDLEEEPV